MLPDLDGNTAAYGMAASEIAPTCGRPFMQPNDANGSPV